MYVGSARGPYQQGFQKAEEGKEEQDEEGQRYRQGKGWNWQKGECSEFFLRNCLIFIHFLVHKWI